MIRKKTDKEFKNEYYEKFPESQINIIGNYEGSKLGIKCKCKICEHIWMPRAAHLLNGSGCPKCAGHLQKSTKEFITEYYKKFSNSTIDIKGEYITNNVPIKCKCKICDYEWSTAPSTLLKGCGCPKCLKHIKKDTTLFCKEYYEKFPDSNVNIIGEYVTAKKPIKCVCKVCGLEWLSAPSKLLLGHGCKECAKLSIRKTLTKTTAQFKKEYYEKFPNSTINIIGEYIKSNSRIKCECKDCGYKWEPFVRSLINGICCPKCRPKKIKYSTKTTEDFINEYYKKYPDSKIKIIGEYINADTPINCKCKTCECEWEAKPSHLLQYSACANCAGNLRYTTETFIKKLNQNYPYNNIIVKGKYINAKKRIECECGTCHKIWYPKARDLLRGRNCPYCATLKTERTFGIFLDSLGISYKPQKKFNDCKNIKPLPFDYEINDERFTTFLLEYQGEQHEHPVDFAGKGSEWAEKNLELRKINDKIKYDFCKNTNRPLEYIWYYENNKIQILINLLYKYIKPEYDLNDILNNSTTNKTA